MSGKVEKSIEEVLKKYFGISLPRIGIGILMLIFGILVIVLPALISWLVGLYLIIAGILVIVEEYMRSKAFASTSKGAS
ncbi:hypothetical protein Igag_1831 [Ignisphaera aggregans DSM 17230]|uniref:DUF3096 domain-containing protein n=1 Tax=Ignisphaera aggregans (strain DSM 17230 / JCM 13409 / AQ1.S1) TaxID=583356 RepID=E0SSP3_IGNAA|nr:hypothetical protein Igag_1831 [Ignisphaera aggregans DSM 17230]